MLITRKTQVPLHWVFYAQIAFVMSIGANYITGAPFLYAMKKFIDNPAAITFFLSIEVFVTMLGGPFVSWLSDRIWTRFGRRRIFIVAADIPKALCVLAMPFAPNLMTLICLRWAYGIFGDLGSPNQALTMEVVPAKQRGMGAGFFKLQGQIVNLFFFLLVVGRLDDVYFTGPFAAISAVSGEVLVFSAGGILFLAVAFYTWFGFHEVQPGHMKTLKDDRRPGESLIKLFLRSFFTDVFHKTLLPLYLLMMVGTLTNISLGVLGPLLYTDQWKYSLQEMGTNIAIGSFIGIFFALLAGWLADRTSKMKVYTWGLILTLLSRIAWTIFVAMKPGQRPDLHEILLFGTLTNIFGLIAGAASFPLILEYVERNRLGTAGAGMGLFRSLFQNGFVMMTGFYILFWSIFFLPQAGDRTELVFQKPTTAPALTAKLEAAGYPTDALDLKALFRPGTDGDTSRHWQIRRAIPDAGDLHKQIKDLENEVSSIQLKIKRPGTSPENQLKLNEEVAKLRATVASTRATLQSSSASFEADMLRIFGQDLVSPGSAISAADSRDGGTQVSLTLDFVEPVTTDVTPRTFAEVLGLSEGPAQRLTVSEEYARVLQTLDLDRAPDPAKPGTYLPLLTTTPISSGDRNAIQITLTRDPDFVAIENALTHAGVQPGKAYETASSLIGPLRGLTRDTSEAYTLAMDSATPESLDFTIRLTEPAKTPVHADGLQSAFGLLKSVVSSRVTAAGNDTFHVSLQLKPLPKQSEESASPESIRLQSLLPGATPAEIRALETLTHRAIESAAARPVFLTAPRPVVVSAPADREYDYFFSMQYFMIITDILGIAIIYLIVRLEKSGRIVRYGALEDANR